MHSPRMPPLVHSCQQKGEELADQILLYTAPWCPDCHRARHFLDEQGVEYTPIDIDEDPQAAVLLEEKTGKRGIPFLVIDGEWVRAYEPAGGAFPRERLSKALGLDRSS